MRRITTRLSFPSFPGRLIQRLVPIAALTLTAVAVAASPASALPDCQKIPEPPRCEPDWEPEWGWGPDYEKTYRLQLESLQVIETEDWGPDEAYIAFSRDYRWGPVEVDNGQSIDLRHLANWRFVNSSQSLTLFDLDAGTWWDPHDQLGFFVAHTGDADGSLRVHDFTDHGAHYRLSYRIFYEGCRSISKPCP